ncbi:hypothetical protein CMK11_09930 [Candidatus Poribacteria bacterium]|nr:hypothetical protein [Candidatus Poribacteria bacterium]
MRSKRRSSSGSDRTVGCLVLLCFLCLAGSSARGEPEAGGREPTYLLIVNAATDVQEMSCDDLAEAFLGKRTLWEDDTRIAPAMLRDRDEATREFIEAVVGRTVRQFRAYWRKRLFAGRGSGPKTFRSSEQVIEFVKDHSGAVAVIRADDYVETDGTKPLTISEEVPAEPAQAPTRDEME